MPDSIALLAQADAQLDLHRARDFKGRGVVEIGQGSHQAQPSELHKEVGLNAKLVAVKVQVGVESAHVHVDQRLAPLVVWAGFGVSRLVPDQVGQGHQLDVVVMLAQPAARAQLASR